MVAVRSTGTSASLHASRLLAVSLHRLSISSYQFQCDDGQKVGVSERTAQASFSLSLPVFRSDASGHPPSLVLWGYSAAMSCEVADKRFDFKQAKLFTVIH